MVIGSSYGEKEGLPDQREFVVDRMVGDRVIGVGKCYSAVMR